MSGKSNIGISTFIDRVRAELIRRKGGWLEISMSTRNPRLSLRWIGAFARNEYLVIDAESLFELARCMGMDVKIMCPSLAERARAALYGLPA